VPAFKALVAQLLGCVAVVVLLAADLLPQPAPLALAVMQGGFAAATASALRSARWWLPIHLLFAPAAVLASRLDVAPTWFLAVFVVLALVYWSSFRSQVPLYLTNRSMAQALLDLLPAERPTTFIDLGCGTGGLLRLLARRRPDCRFVGVENAPLPYLVARFGARGLANCRILRGNFWQQALTQYDVIYAFLSPVPMLPLWQKARKEMRPGAVLISNSFPVPEAAPARVVEVADRRRTRLYCYVP
jgi:hypothetical protein